MPGESARINGCKGGRPPGPITEEEAQRREMRKRFIQRCFGKADEIFDAHDAVAYGHWVQVVKDDGTIERVYKTSPDRAALAWMMEHVWGKAKQTIDFGTSDDPELDEVFEALLKPFTRKHGRAKKNKGDTRETETGAEVGAQEVGKVPPQAEK